MAPEGPPRHPQEGTPRGSTLAGVALVVTAAAWLPGQSHTGAVRAWVVLGLVPLWTYRSVFFRTDLAWRWLLPWGALVTWDLVAAALSPTPGPVLDGTRVQVGWLLALLVGMRLGTEPGSLGTLARFAALAGALAAGPGLLAEGGAFGNRDLLAGFLVCTLVLTTECLRRREQREWRRAHWLSLAVQVVALALTRSLGAFLALAVALWALHGLRWLGAHSTRRRLRPWLVVLPLLGCALLLAVPTVWQHVEGRVYLWRLGSAVALQAWPWGVGLGGLHGPFLEEQALYLAAPGHPAELWTNAAHAHNELVHVLAEQGVPGLVLLLLPLLGALSVRRATVAWGVVLAAGVVGLVSTPLYEPATAWLVALCAGHGLQRRQAARPRPRTALAVRGGMLLLATAALLLSTAELLGDRLLARGVREHAPGMVAWAAQLSLRPERAWQYQADLLVDTEPGAAGELAQDAVARDPSPSGWLLVGRAAMGQADYAQAIAAFRQAVRLHPRLFAGHFNLALAYEAAGDRFSARRHAERARSLRPTDPRLGRLPN